MIINHNMGSMNAQRNMGINSTNASKSMEKLSSGLRINKAGDDAAGLAISEKMRGQIRGLDQASANAQDGISMIGTAEGALNETTSILQRMRELAVQGANDTNTTDDRTQIQKEMNQLTSEVSRIGNHTEFNTQSLLKGGTATAYTGGIIGTKSGDASNLTIGMGTYSGANITGATVDTSGVTVTPGATTYGSSDSKVENITGFTGDIAGLTLTWTDTNADVTLGAGELGVTGAVGWTATFAGTNGTDLVATITDGIRSFDYNMGATALADTTGVSIGGITGAVGASTFGGSIAIGDTTFTVAADGSTTAGAGTYSDLTVDASGLVAAGTGTGAFDITGGTQAATASTSFTFQIGANQSQQFTATISDMRSSALGVAGTAGDTAVGVGTAVDGASFVAVGTANDLSDVSTDGEHALDVSDATKASAAIKVLDAATASVSAERAKLGAYSNRLEHTIANLGTSSENLTSAESRIRDVDMAKEMSTFSKNNILSQAAQAMLAQANQQPQQVLQLLR